MRNFLLGIVVALMLLAEVYAVTPSARSEAVPRAASESPTVTAWGSRLVVCYPSENKAYIYTELGGNCVFAYTLSTPGGPLARENCK